MAVQVGDLGARETEHGKWAQMIQQVSDEVNRLKLRSIGMNH